MQKHKIQYDIRYWLMPENERIEERKKRKREEEEQNEEESNKCCRNAVQHETARRPNYMWARKWYKWALEKNENHIEANYGLALIYFKGRGIKQQNLNQAKIYCNKILEIKSDYFPAIKLLLQIDYDQDSNKSADEWFELGRQHSQFDDDNQPDYIRKICYYELALERDSSHFTANYDLAVMYYEGTEIEGNLEQAENYCEAALNANPEDEETIKLLQKIRNSQNNKNIDEQELNSEDTSEEQDELNKSADDWFNEGLQHSESIDEDESENIFERQRYCYEQALKKNNNHFAASYNLALIYFEGRGVGQDIRKAEIYCNNSLNTNPDYLPAIKLMLQIEWYEKNESAKSWNDLGTHYLKSTDKKQKCPVKARCCFELALNLATINDNEYFAANCNLSYIYYSVLDEVIEARKHCEMALNSKPNDFNVVKLFLHIEHGGKNKSAKDWNALGIHYGNGTDGKQRCPIKARCCFELALKLAAVNVNDNEYFRASCFLAHIYSKSLGVKKNLVEAKKYCQMALNSKPENYMAIKLSLQIDYDGQNKSAKDWNNLGASYYKGTSGEQQDYVKARCCFELALGSDNEYLKANFSLTMIYYKGLGVKQNSNEAKRYCEKMLDIKGDYDKAAKIIMKIENNAVNLNADGWNQLGVNYHDGLDGKVENSLLARCCFVLALKKNKNHAYANFNLGTIIYHLYKCVDSDNKKNQHRDNALKFYLVAHANSLDKKNLKIAELRIMELRFNVKNLDALDDNGNTFFHCMAEKKSYKNCARIMFFGANHEVLNRKDKKTPFAYLSLTESETVETLESRLTTDWQTLKERSAVDVLAPQLIFKNTSVTHNLENIKNGLEILYKNNLLKPLLDLAKFAACGCHRLSKRKKFDFEDDNYDSDDDNMPENILNQSQQLLIKIDAKRPTVEYIAIWENNGMGGKHSVGVYKHQNTIYIGGMRNTKDPINNEIKVRGTFIHELTHFLTREVFDNDCKPYFRNNPEMKKKFKKIADDLEKNQDILPDILQSAFSKSYKEKNQIHDELIVRIPQLLVENPNMDLNTYENGIIKPLFEFYKNEFLGAVNNHIKKLELIIFKDLPEEMYTANRQNEFSFQYN